jgi:hypothetical protein
MHTYLTSALKAPLEALDYNLTYRKVFVTIKQYFTQTQKEMYLAWKNNKDVL